MVGSMMTIQLWIEVMVRSWQVILESLNFDVLSPSRFR